MKKSNNRYMLWVVFKDNREVVVYYVGTLNQLRKYIKFWDDDDYILSLEEVR